MLGLLETFTLHPEALDVARVREVLDTGVTREAIRDAFYVAFLFNTLRPTRRHARVGVAGPPVLRQGGALSLEERLPLTRSIPSATSRPMRIYSHGSGGAIPVACRVRWRCRREPVVADRRFALHCNESSILARLRYAPFRLACIGLADHSVQRGVRPAATGLPREHRGPSGGAARADDASKRRSGSSPVEAGSTFRASTDSAYGSSTRQTVRLV